MFGSGLYLAGLGLFAAAVGLLVRHTAAALSIVLALVFVVGNMVFLLPGAWGEWIGKLMPGNAGLGGRHAGVVQPGAARPVGRLRRVRRRGRRPAGVAYAGLPAPGRLTPSAPAVPRPVRPGHSGAVTSPDPAAEGRRRADHLLTLLATDDAAADRLLAELTEVRDLVFLGPGSPPSPAPRRRRLPPAQRAQANTRQVRLGRCATPTAATPTGCATGCAGRARRSCSSGSQQAIADRVEAEAQERTATRAAAEANGTAAASSAATTT